jgi:hypothetical protein
MAALKAAAGISHPGMDPATRVIVAPEVGATITADRYA